MNRRQLLRGAGAALLCAPAIVSAANIMPILVRKPEWVVWHHRDFSTMTLQIFAKVGGEWVEVGASQLLPDGTQIRITGADIPDAV